MEIAKIMNCTKNAIRYHLYSDVRKKNFKDKSKYRQDFKKMLRDLHGSKCLICGYNKCVGALEFHHLKPSGKDDCVMNYVARASKNKAIEEVKKCVLVCCNCHREIHEGITKLDDLIRL